MMHHLTKIDYTKLVIDQLPVDDSNLWKNMSLDTLLFSWWKTGRGGTGLRLTEQGMDAFEVAEIDHYDFTFGNEFSSVKDWHSFLQKMTKCIECPYYIGITQNKNNLIVRIYDHKIAMMITLYGGILYFIDRKSMDK